MCAFQVKPTLGKSKSIPMLYTTVLESSLVKENEYDSDFITVIHDLVVTRFT